MYYVAHSMRKSPSPNPQPEEEVIGPITLPCLPQMEEVIVPLREMLRFADASAARGAGQGGRELAATPFTDMPNDLAWVCYLVRLG